MAQIEQRTYAPDETVRFGPATIEPHPLNDRPTRIRWLRLDGVRVEYIGAGPSVYRAVPVGADGRGDPPQLLLAVPVSGDIRGERWNRPHVLASGAAMVLSNAYGFRVEAAEGVQMFRLVVDEPMLGEAGRAALDGPLVEYRPNPLIRGFEGLLRGLLIQQDRALDPAEALATGRLLVSMLESLLRDQVRSAPGIPAALGRDERRARMQDYVAAHLPDPNLGPRTIATAFGVSLRTVHLDFPDPTVGAYIRQQRLERLVVVLETQERLPSLTHLAAMARLNPGSLGAAFQKHTGSTVRQWWDDRHAG